MEDRLPESGEKRRFFLIEIWEDQRDAFKAIVADVLLFGLLLGVLWLAYYVMEQLHYPQERKETIEKIHYYGYLLILVIFMSGFIIKVLAFEFEGVRQVRKRGRSERT